MQEPAAGDPLVDLVRRKAEELRRSALVPPDLEQRLDAHAEAVASDPELPAEKVRRAASAVHFTPRLPPGVLTRLLGPRLLGPLLAGLEAALVELAGATRQALEAAAEALEDPANHSHPDLRRQLDHLLDRLARIDRLPEGTEGLADLRRRVERLEARLSGPPDQSG